MASHADIERIARILARATSENEAEADTALRGAFARMVRDGVSFTDLLTLPTGDLYQDALVRLAEHIVKNQSDLSPSQRRAAYAEYLARIVGKFGGTSQDESRGGEQAEDQAKREREEQKRAYEERRRQEEERRRQTASSAGARSTSQQTNRPDPQSRQNSKAGNGGGLRFQIDPSRYPIEIPWRAFFLFFFGANSYIGSIYSYPYLAMHLIIRSCLVGGATFGVLMFAVAFLVSWTQFYPLRLFASFYFYNLPLTAALIIFITSYVLYERGWYPRGPLRGETDIVSIAISTKQLFIALAMRLILAIAGACKFLQNAWQRSRTQGK